MPVATQVRNNSLLEFEWRRTLWPSSKRVLITVLAFLGGRHIVFQLKCLSVAQVMRRALSFLCTRYKFPIKTHPQPSHRTVSFPNRCGAAQPTSIRKTHEDYSKRPSILPIAHVYIHKKTLGPHATDIASRGSARAKLACGSMLITKVLI